MPCPSDIEEIYEVITALEGAAAARLARLPMEERPVIQLLKAATKEMVDALADSDLPRWTVADEDFHQTLVIESGNSRLMRMAGTVADQLHRARMFTLNLRPLPLHSAGEHAEIIDAIERGDAEAASRSARLHRKHAHDALIPLLLDTIYAISRFSAAAICTTRRLLVLPRCANGNPATMTM
ncbi:MULTISPECIES: GntR family transcriptional regulator [Rhizobium]|uniref:GntR family transcriptional regulator n=1 Tax=Rhizobium TaxID=379 RepID=UPI001F0C0082|nr:FCD domain-containing protein [Rhizobium leguminosarum]MCH4549509.1 FCD domain-containing protein [Rhizobium changzhiense]